MLTLFSTSILTATRLDAFEHHGQSPNHPPGQAADKANHPKAGKARWRFFRR